MISIAQDNEKRPEQGPFTSSFSYALKVTPVEMQDMSREQLLAVCVEQYALLMLIIGIAQNARAQVTTRLVAIDLLIAAVRRTSRRLMHSVVDRMPVVILHELPGSMSDRLGISENTVSTCLSQMESCGAVKKSYRKGESGYNKHLDISIQPEFLADPGLVRDKREKKPEERRASAKREKAVPAACAHCGSESLVCVCRSCGEMLDVQSGEVTVAGGDPLPPVPMDAVDGDIPHDENVQAADSAEEQKDHDEIPRSSSVDLSPDDTRLFETFVERLKANPPKPGIGTYHVSPVPGVLLKPREYYQLMRHRLRSPVDMEKRWAREEIERRLEAWHV